MRPSLSQHWRRRRRTPSRSAAAADFLGKWGTSGTGEGEVQTVCGIGERRERRRLVRGRLEGWGREVHDAGGSSGPSGRYPVRGRRLTRSRLRRVSLLGRTEISTSSKTSICTWASRSGPEPVVHHVSLPTGGFEPMWSSPCRARRRPDACGSVYIAELGTIESRTSMPDGRYVTSIGRGEGAARLVGQKPLDAARSRDRSGREHLRQRRAGPACAALRADGRFLGSFGVLGCGSGVSSRAPVGVVVGPLDGSLWRGRSLALDGAALHRRRSLSGDARPARVRRRWVQPPHLPRAGLQGSLYVADVDNYRVQRFGDRGTAPCGNAAADPSERLKLPVGSSAPALRPRVRDPAAGGVQPDVLARSLRPDHSSGRRLACPPPAARAAGTGHRQAIGRGAGRREHRRALAPLARRPYRNRAAHPDRPRPCRRCGHRDASRQARHLTSRRHNGPAPGGRPAPTCACNNTRTT